jgi:hypothetical protein
LATLTIQPDATAGKDAMLSSGLNAPNNFGDTDPIWIGLHVFSKSPLLCREIISFDVSGVPLGATIQSAVLTLKATLATGISSSTFTAVRVRRADWSESQVTWNQYKTSLNWTSAGASNTSSDQDTTNQDTCVLSGGTNLVFNNLKNLTLDALANRSGILHLLIIGPEGGSSETSAQICTSDNATPSNRPALVITYAFIVARRNPSRRVASRGAA